MAQECPNKMVMIIKFGNIESESEREDDDDMPSLKDCSEVEYAKGENLVVQRTLICIIKKMNMGSNVRICFIIIV